MVLYHLPRLSWAIHGRLFVMPYLAPNWSFQNLRVPFRQGCVHYDM